MELTGLSSGFRDGAQRWRVQSVVRERLADDRAQEECRYLMRFVWQLAMTYQEVTMDELRAHVGAEKLAAVESLVEAIGQSPEQIDAWIIAAEEALPIIHDRGYEQGI